MPALVNYGGDDDFYSGRSACSANSGLVLSIADFYCPPRKHSHVSTSYAVEVHMFDKERNPSIETLPDECLFEIFRHFPGARGRCATACVSKRWLLLLSSVRSSKFCRSKSPQEQLVGKEVSQTMIYVETISANRDLELKCDGYLTRSLEEKKATDVRLAAIAVGTTCRGGLGKLSVWGCNSVRGVTNSGLSAIAHGCPSLRALSMWNVPAIGDEGLFEIARECHSLEKLDLCQCPSISDKGLVAVAKNCSNLISLTIESCSSIGNESLQAIGKYCPKLQSITIKDYPLVGDQGVAGLLSSTSVVLTKVKLQVLKITDFSLAVIGHYGKSLTNLVLTGLQNVSQKGFWVMGNAQGLQMLYSLAITSCRGTSDLSLEALGKGCPNLKQMYLRKCCFVSDNGLVAFAKAAGSLESLQVEECNRITRAGILNALSKCNSKLKSLSIVKCIGIKGVPLDTPVLSHCKSLRSLSIRSCPWFNSTSLALVGKLCPQLHHLDLSGLCGITDAALLPLLESCESLVKINLSYCLNLTDEIIVALTGLHGGTLELLNLEGCKKVTDASLVAIADSCLFLNDLDLSKCSITDSGVAALSSGVHMNLQVLSLSGCSMVSKRSMTHLKKLGETLVGLNLQHCNSICSSTIQQLVEYLWRCDILS